MSALSGSRLVFGAGGAVAGLSAAELLDLAQGADELGYEVFSLSDHLHSTRPTVEPLTTLSWLAGQTRRIELVTNVLALPYRAPAVLAKTAETLDRLSGGRFVLGLGGGGYDEEFHAFGLPARTGGQKIQGQREAIAILRGLWSGKPTTLHGQEFSVNAAQIDPKSDHQIPIWLGSYGPQALALTGELADGWLPSIGRVGLGKAAQMRAAVLDAAARAGRDPASIVCATNVIVRVGARLPASSGVVSGDVPEVIGHLVDIVRVGFTALLLAVPTVRELELLARDVLPAVREQTAGRGPLPGAAAGTEPAR
ncbi:Luciferase-like monooxygenase [Frankia sp. AiPs1]|uniref:LLM class flavin-dependent oxidoreductase n=1 Tax=Frankia sp. AiPa1 TaxID=573492 RepID=UPI00202B405C|nr:LLM class flavin-dependent oxidoreductase [Frankia sp. AiPa1]MCL9759336.1 LLM class flavin-dependent oxidoreductase [Frankia sp. AiPa1]